MVVPKPLFSKKVVSCAQKDCNFANLNKINLL